MTIYPAKLLECFRERRSTHHCPRITVGKPEKHTNPSHACRLLGIERQWPNGNAPPKSMMNSRRFIRSTRETTELNRAYRAKRRAEYAGRRHQARLDALTPRPS